MTRLPKTLTLAQGNFRRYEPNARDDIAEYRFDSLDNGTLAEPPSEWLELWSDSVEHSEAYDGRWEKP